MILIAFTFCLICLIAIGFFCASKLSHEHPFWVRMIVLMPSLAALGGLFMIVEGEYVAYISDVVLCLSTIPLYGLVASRFTDNPWLDIRVDGE